LASSDVDFRRVIEAAPDGIVISREGRILFANLAAARCLGHPAAADLVGRSMAEFLDPAELLAMRERIAATVRAGTTLPPREYVARRGDGGTVTAEVTSLPIEWEGAPAVIALVRDVTERARLQEELARSHRMAALGALAAGVAHEIKNPLGYVSLGIESLDGLIARSLAGADRPEAEALLARLREGVDRVAGIVRDLRAFALEHGAGAGESTDLRDVVAAVERLVAHEVRHRVLLVVDVPDLPRVPGPPQRHEQVLVNLLLNAAQAFPVGARHPRVSLQARASGGRVVVEVTDNGPGIPEEIRARIFDPFFSTKSPAAGAGAGGMGLGLAICHRIVTQLGGDLSVTSEPGAGSTFRITLPVSPSASLGSEPLLAVASATGLPKEPAEPASPSSKPIGKRRILVIDDELPIGRSLEALLGSDHSVEAVSSGAEALARIAADPSWEVAICDLMMPSMTGMELHARVVEVRPGFERRMIFMTGGAFTARAAEFLATVPNPRVEKPFRLREIEAALRAALR